MIGDTVKELKARKSAIRSEIATLNAEDKKIDRVIAAIIALPTSTPVATAAKVKTGKKRKFSAATLAKMRKAQQARWANIKGPKTAVVAPAAKPAKKKGKMSAAGKAKLSALMKARWAAKKKAAKK